MRVDVSTVRPLLFDDGSPVRAASAIAPLDGGWLVAQDDAAHAAWLHGGQVHRVRVLPPVAGHDVFSSADGTKPLKPDLEAACAVRAGALLLGSGSTDRRMRAALVTPTDVTVADLSPLYAAVARLLERDPADLNLEGACLLDGVLRWFARGNLTAGVPSASVDVDLAALLAAVGGSADPAGVVPRRPLTYDLGEVDGVGLTVTDAVALLDGRILLSCAAEDTPNAYDDGPVVAAALALVARDEVLEVVPLPQVHGRVVKVEGLAVQDTGPGHVRLLAVVDDDDVERPSTCLELRVEL